MLETLTIENFGFIERSELRFSPGLNVVTGESGSGKSLVLDALGFVLGARRGRAPFRASDAELKVEAVFRLDRALRQPDLTAELGARSGPRAYPEWVRLTRTAGKNGKNSCYVNGERSSLQRLAAFGSALVERSLQGDAHLLREEGAQLALIDGALGLSDMAREVASRYLAFQALASEEDGLAKRVAELGARRELLVYQLEELERAHETDAERLEAQVRELEGRIKSCGPAEAALAELRGDGSACPADGLTMALRFLRRGGDGMAALEADLMVALENISRVTRELEQRLENSAEEQQEHAVLSSELSGVRALAQKHRVAVGELTKVEAAIRAELTCLAELTDRLVDLRARLVGAEREVLERARHLHGRRQAGLRQLEEKIAENLRLLELNPRIQLELNEAPLGPHGTSRLRFLLQSSASLPARPLATVASGGELSRVLLGLLLTKRDHAELLVLDEIDSGTGGGTAAAVGRMLVEARDSAQILCVTHSAQLACLADRHIGLRRVAGSRTEVAQLEGESRVDELARMLGGTDAARRHASELLAAPIVPPRPKLRRVA